MSRIVNQMQAEFANMGDVARQTGKSLDVMLCTHGHFDHIGDAVELAIAKTFPQVVDVVVHVEPRRE